MDPVLRLCFRSTAAHHDEDAVRNGGGGDDDEDSAHLQDLVKLVEFEEFVGLCSILSPMASPQEKAAFLARVIDADNDGYVSYDNAFALLKALHGARLSDAVLEQATLAFLHSCGVEEENLFDNKTALPRRLTDREFSIWHIRQTARNARPVNLRNGAVNTGGDPAGHSRVRVPRYVVERLLVDDMPVQQRMTMEFNLDEHHKLP